MLVLIVTPAKRRALNPPKTLGIIDPEWDRQWNPIGSLYGCEGPCSGAAPCSPACEMLIALDIDAAVAEFRNAYIAAVNGIEYRKTAA